LEDVEEFISLKSGDVDVDYWNSQLIFCDDLLTQRLNFAENDDDWTHYGFWSDDPD
jgi:hypothetical protein